MLTLGDACRQPLQRLSRLALDNWTIAPQTLNRGPFRVQNLDEARTIQASGETGSITLTASAETFRAILDGELNATTAFMTGKLSVDGSMGLAMKLGSVLG